MIRVIVFKIFVQLFCDYLFENYSLTIQGILNQYATNFNNSNNVNVRQFSQTMVLVMF